jgi:hypothetical protein
MVYLHAVHADSAAGNAEVERAFGFKSTALHLHAWEIGVHSTGQWQVRVASLRLLQIEAL